VTPDALLCMQTKSWLLFSNSNPQFQIAARHPMKYWEIIADNLKKAGWSLGCVAMNRNDTKHRFWLSSRRTTPDALRSY
jgi:hypothetical protein